MKLRCPLFLSNDYDKVQSRYLNASLGSCHDLCKFGQKHNSEDSQRCYRFERFTANGVIAISVKNHVKDLKIRDSKERSRIKVNEQTLASENTVNINVKTRSCADDKVNHLNLSNLRKKEKIKHVMKSKTTITQDKQKSSTSTSAPRVITQKNARVSKSSPSYKFEKMKKNASFSSRIIGGIAEHASSIRSIRQLNHSTSLNDPNNCNQKVDKNFEMPEFQEMKSVKLKKASVCSKKASHGVASFKARKSRNLQYATHEREGKPEKHEGSNHEKVSEITEPIVEKTCLDYNLKNCNIGDDGYASESLISEISEIEEMQIKQNHETVLDIFQSKSENKGLDHIQENSDEDNGYAFDSLLGEVSELTEIEEMQTKQDHAKIFEFNEPRSENIGLEHNQENFNNKNCGYSSESPVSELSEDEEMRMKRNHDKRRARMPKFELDDNSSSPYKVKFKRGRVVELRAVESFVPQRLTFRRVRELDENPSIDAVKKTLMRREVSDSNTAMLKQLDSEAKAVVLKHQDQQKKEMQSLFNLVIEETASKLEETRKSKVKALVGAFETVISLQQTKRALAV